jgi:hypothetical protein
MWSLGPGRMHTREGQKSRVVRQAGRGSTGTLPSLFSLQLLEAPQGRLCLLVAMLPVGGCITARQGQQADRLCGLKGPCSQLLWEASTAPEGKVPRVLPLYTKPLPNPMGLPGN